MRRSRFTTPARAGTSRTAKALYRIVRVDQDKAEVLLEDCSCPETALLGYRVGELIADGFRRVKPLI